MLLRRGGLFFLTFVFLSVFLSAGVYAQNQTEEVEQAIEPTGDDSQDVSADSGELNTLPEDSISDDFEAGVELGTDSGTTPDSALYFVDEFFDGFGDNLQVREEKVAEIKAMVEEGKIDEARVALESYNAHADEFEREVAPEERDEARRSASAIYNTLKEIEDQIPEGDRGDFVDNVVEKEKGIITASEIASKIRDLCESLANLDPLEYARVCKTEGDAPSWQKKLNKDLTDEQRKEAEKFGKIMQQCFETAGQQCACEEIPFTDFASTCSIAAPLATACNIEGNEAACEKLDNLEMPELPSYLQDVMDSLENDVSGSRIDLHMPIECREAGATNSDACRKIMIQTNAPEECRQALLDANVKNEREGREICDKIMFELNAPPECVEAGLTNPKECGKLMFQQNAPQECIDAGITGENRNDPKKCEEIMGGFEGNREGPRQGGFGGNCREIQNPEERLKCYDGVTQGIGERAEKMEMNRKEVRNYRQIEGQKCPDNTCDEFERTHSYACPEDCGGIRENRPPEEFREQIPQENFNEPGEFNEFQEGEGFIPPEEQFTEPAPETTESSGTTETSPASEPIITGEVVNNFYNYYFR